MKPECPKCKADARMVEPVENKAGWFYCNQCAKTFQELPVR